LPTTDHILSQNGRKTLLSCHRDLKIIQMKEIVCNLHNIQINEVGDIILYLASQEFILVRFIY